MFCCAKSGIKATAINFVLNCTGKRKNMLTIFPEELRKPTILYLQTVQEKFVSAMVEYYYEKMEQDNRKKVCPINYDKGCFHNLPAHSVLLCSPRLAFNHIKNFPESVLHEYGDLADELRIRIHFLWQNDRDMFYAHIGFSRRISSFLVQEQEAPEDRSCFPHVLTTVAVPVKDFLELEEAEIRDFAYKKCAEIA